jgi:hypothetical protein
MSCPSPNVPYRIWHGMQTGVREENNICLFLVSFHSFFGVVVVVVVGVKKSLGGGSIYLGDLNGWGASMEGFLITHVNFGFRVNSLLSHHGVAGSRHHLLHYN